MQSAPVVIRAAGVFGVPGATVVRVEGDRITAVGGTELITDRHLPHETPVVEGGWLLPGLMDAHVHLGPGTARLAALHGVTTVFDQFSTPDLIADERERIARPDNGVCANVRVAGIGATAPGGHPTMAYAPIPYVTGPHDARAFVEARVRDGATHLKVIYDEGSSAHMDLAALRPDTIRALVTAAHENDLVVVAHVSTAAGAVLVAECGADVLGHVPFEPMTGEQIERVAQAQVAAIPTLSLVDGFPNRDGRLPLEADPVLTPRLTPSWARVLRAQAQRWMPPTGLDIESARANVAALHAAGVPILAGTDAPNPGLVIGLSLHRELQHLVAAGLTPQQAVTAATQTPAEVFRLAGRGRIEVGARADLVLVEGNPADDVTATGRVQHTWIAGQEVTPAAADTDTEAAQIAWIGRTNAKIVAAIEEKWPEWEPGPAPEPIMLTGVTEVDADLPALTHPDKDVRQGAAVALGTLAHPSSAPALVARLRDEPDFFVRETVTWAVTRVGEAARELVEDLATSPDTATATQALHVLSKIASPLSLPTLSRFTGAADDAVAAKARFAVTRLGTPDGIELLTRHLGEGGASAQKQLATDLASYDAEHLPIVVDLVGGRLGDDEPDVRRHAADVLIHIGPPAAAAAPALERALADSDEHVRISAAMALYEMGAPGAEALARYDGPDRRLREVARRARS